MEGSRDKRELEASDLNIMGETEFDDNQVEQRYTGYGTIRAVIFSTLQNVPTPKSSDFYNFTQVNMDSLDGYCLGICLKCAAEVNRFESAGVLDLYLRNHESPVELDGRGLTPICEGMWMHQEYLDTHTCTFCNDPLRKECTDY